MKKLEVILPSLFLIACLMYVYHYPGAGFLKVVVAMTVSMFYMVSSFALLNGLDFKAIFKNESYKTLKAMHIVLASIAGVVLSYSVFAILFLTMRWPGAFMMAFFSTVLLILISVVCLVLHAIKKAEVYKSILRRTFVFLSIVVILWSVTKMYWEIDLEEFKAEIESYK